jgi:hypothetical protein
MEGYRTAIANVKALGAANASKNDVEMVKRMAQQAGPMGNAARDALGANK